jgi:hypothetical protein
MIHVTIRATADELLKEYKACESPDYISYVRRPQYFSLHHSVTRLRLFRDPTKVNRPGDTLIVDVFSVLYMYWIPTKCIKLLFSRVYTELRATTK